MGKKLKLADIAALAGVSKSTVSFVLNGHAEKHRITKETVQRVMQVVEANNYSPSLYARALKSKKSSTFGLVIPDLLNLGFASIAKELERLCLASGYQLLLASTDDDPETEMRAVDNLISRQVDGIMVASCLTSDAFYCGLPDDLPLVFFDRSFESSGFNMVTTDAYDATRVLLTEHTKNVAECVFIGGQLELSPSKERYQGYVDALAANQIPFNQNLVFNLDYQPSSGYDMMAACVDELGRLPHCLFTASYSLLEGVLRYLNEHDLFATAVNDRMRIATFDNYAILDCLPLQIDSIEQNCVELASEIFDCLQKTLSNSQYQSKISVKAHLHQRSY